MITNFAGTSAAGATTWSSLQGNFSRRNAERRDQRLRDDTILFQIFFLKDRPGDGPFLLIWQWNRGTKNQASTWNGTTTRSPTSFNRYTCSQIPRAEIHYHLQAVAVSLGICSHNTTSSGEHKFTAARRQRHPEFGPFLDGLGVAGNIAARKIPVILAAAKDHKRYDRVRSWEWCAGNVSPMRQYTSRHVFVIC